MGMAASQARFLGLTARLNNVEFEAQQIHQQRTSLSNKSASYYSDLLGLAVPVAPSVDAYTQTVYTFDDGALTNQITSMVANTNGTYTVSYLKTWDDDFAIVAATPSIVTHTTGSDYLIGTQYLRKAGDADDPHIGDDAYYMSLDATTQRPKLIAQETDLAAKVLSELGLTSGDVYVRYVENTTTGEYEPIFYLKKDFEAAPAGNGIYDSNGHSINNINAYKVGTKQRMEEVIGVAGCQFEQDATGRYININIPNVGKYALTTNTITDQDAYDDAMNQYEYDKAIYDQSIADINAKIEIVQAEDKNLELRLKQLDTEHNAIQTERDQVKELIKKNVDSSFKTFG
ncbi:hypothetical protein J6S88_00125 [bacterium]|nr:hypothetical protein [bacterium]